jgi:HSP20 family molecular chaperone IbpA
MAIPKTAFTSKPKSTEPRFIGKSEAEALEWDIQQRVSARAYRLFEESGYQDGNAEKHWLQAESEVLQRGIEVRESGSWVALNAKIPDASAEDVHIYVDPTRVIVRARKNGQTENRESQAQGLPDDELFLAVDLNVEVDPTTASASLKDSKLSLMVKKRPQKSASGVLESSS